MKDATATRDKIIREAKDRATAEGNRILEDARQQIVAEREKALRANREEVANLSIQVASKVIAKNLQEDKQQVQYIDSLLNEMSIFNK